MTIREEAERRRVLYVGMTRAKDLLLLSGSVTARSASESVLAQLQAIGEGKIGAAATQALTVGKVAIQHTVVTAPERRSAARLRTDSTQMPGLDAKSLTTLWQARTARWKDTCSTPSHLTPTSLGSLQSPDTYLSPRTGQDRDVGRLVGVMAHRILERWEFNVDPAHVLEMIRASVPEWLGKDHQSLAQTVVESLLEIFDSFIRSEPYRQLEASTILGREVPFLISWDGNRVMQGVIDLIYRLDGSIWIADYKTDLITEAEAWSRAKQYAQQATIYREAVTRCLGLSPVSFQFLFLRSGIAVTL
jgi:ATP-dependent helicase/nuclease subunit A